MRKVLLMLNLFLLLTVTGCGKFGTSVTTRPYSLSPIKVDPSLDSVNQVEYRLTGTGIQLYSRATVCFRRLNASGFAKSYGEITDTRNNPNTYQMYYTFKKLDHDETGVVVRWIELTSKETGATVRYLNN